MDRENVIAWLTEISSRPCDFTRDDYDAYETELLANEALEICEDAKVFNQQRNDAIALLKEQEHEVCENCPYKLEDIGDFSDGYHTFNDLYLQRAVLFATIVNQNLDKAWKSHKHEDGEPCFGGGWFIVAVDTPKGSYSYHYEDKYWDIFKCVELPVAKHWDGHTDKDVWRLLLLT